MNPSFRHKQPPVQDVADKSRSNIRLIYYVVLVVSTLFLVQLCLIQPATSKESRYGRHLRENYKPGEQVNSSHLYEIASRAKRQVAGDYDGNSGQQVLQLPTSKRHYPLGQVTDLLAQPQSGLSLAQEAQQFDQDGPSLRELAEMGAAAGLVASEQLEALKAKQQQQVEPEGGSTGEQAESQQAGSTLEQPDSADPSPGSDQMPDSMESLMGAPDGDDGGEATPPSPRQATSSPEADEADWPPSDELAPPEGQQVNRADSGAHNNEADTDDYDYPASEPARLAPRPSVAQQHNSLAGFGASNLHVPQLGSQHPDKIDLSTAAGHHYGKKKKKVKKKKKIVIIKKKKKKKKKKKILIIKKKKVYKKKKAPKKKHYHHHHHKPKHDHGKYYM